MTTSAEMQRAGYWVKPGAVVRLHDSAGRYLGKWLCVEGSECGVWKWIDALEDTMSNITWT